MESVSVIIVNFNAGSRLGKCVASVVESGAQAQIIVVDNASEDDSLGKLTAEFNGLKTLRIVRNPKNIGFAAGCNIGTRLATGDYLLFLNPDCILAPGAIQALVNSLKRYPGAGMAGARLLNPDGTEQAGGRRAVPTPWRAFVRVSGLYRLKTRYPNRFSDFLLHLENLPDAEIEVEATSGACMMVTRRAIDDVGGMDDAYFLHAEDLDWCMRLRNKGWKILFVPQARAIHHKGTCSGDRPVRVEWHKHRGMMRFYRKFFHHQYSPAMTVLVAAGVWTHFLVVAGYHAMKSRK